MDSDSLYTLHDKTGREVAYAGYGRVTGDAPITFPECLGGRSEVAAYGINGVLHEVLPVLSVSKGIIVSLGVAHHG